MAAISDVLRLLIPQSPPQGDQGIGVPHTGPGSQSGGWVRGTGVPVVPVQLESWEAAEKVLRETA